MSFATDEDAQRFAREGFEVISLSGRQITVSLKGEMMPLVKALGSYQVVGLEMVAQSLEDVFIHFYGGDTRV